MGLTREQKMLLGLRKKALKVGMRQVAHDSGLARETLYRILSKNGNPRLTTLWAVLSALKMRLTVELRPRRAK